MKRAALALAALVAAATVALAQQTNPPPTGTTPQEQTAAPDSSKERNWSESDKHALMMDCLKQVQAANPSTPPKEVKDYCDKIVKSYSDQLPR